MCIIYECVSGRMVGRGGRRRGRDGPDLIIPIPNIKRGIRIPANSEVFAIWTA